MKQEEVDKHDRHQVHLRQEKQDNNPPSPLACTRFGSYKRRAGSMKVLSRSAILYWACLFELDAIGLALSPTQRLQQAVTPLEVASVASDIAPGSAQSVRTAGDILRRLGKTLSSRQQLLNPSHCRDDVLQGAPLDKIVDIMDASTPHRAEAIACVRALGSLAPLPPATNHLQRDNGASNRQPATDLAIRLRA